MQTTSRLLFLLLFSLKTESKITIQPILWNSANKNVFSLLARYFRCDKKTNKLYLWVCCCSSKHSRLHFCPCEKTVFINFATTTNNSSLASSSSSSSSERAQQHWQQPWLERIYCKTRNLREGRGYTMILQRWSEEKWKWKGSISLTSLIRKWLFLWNQRKRERERERLSVWVGVIKTRRDREWI